MELEPDQEDLDKSIEKLEEELRKVQKRIRTANRKYYLPGKEGRLTVLEIKKAKIQAALKEKKGQ